LTSSGSLDGTFGTGGQTTFDLGRDVLGGTGLALDPAGRIIVAGNVGSGAESTAFAVVRLTSTGNPDSTFGTGGETTLPHDPIFTSFNGGLAVDSTGRIALLSTTGLTGEFHHEISIALTLLEASGRPSLDFGTAGIVTTNLAPQPFDVSRSVGNAVAFDAAGRIVVAGAVSDFTEPVPPDALIRYLGPDPVVEASSPTFAADLQAAVHSLETSAPPGTLRVVVHVADPATISAFTAALANLKVDPNGPTIEVLLDAEPGVYSLGPVSVPAGLRLVLDGDNGLGGSFTGSSGPALTVVSGDVLIRDGALLTATGNTPTIQVQSGHLTMRNSTVEETTGGSQPAFAISGGVVDLGDDGEDEGDAGGNTINVNGPGLLIRNTGPNNVQAAGNTWLQDGVPFANDFRIEDAIDHAMDGLHSGTVFWVPNNVFVSAANGRVQRGVDLVPAGGVVNVEAGVGGHFSAGAKLLTVAFADGSSMTQQIDTLDPSRRSLVVLGTEGNDVIKFESEDDPGVRVEMNNVPSGTFLPTGRLIAIGNDGSDDIEVSSDIHLSAWLYGGASGNNYLQGGGGNDVLVGGFGDDTLIGGGGRDLLIGDAGNDLLVAGSGQDILIGGVTAFDEAAFDSFSEAALGAIMAEWTSADDYQTRVNFLVNGGGLNGSSTLTPGLTVFDDGSNNVLDGGPGRDLFFAGMTDTVKGKRSNETLLPL
jgi:uncharacterized delta-60 repeat protein